MKKLFNQIIKFGMVGIIATCTDYFMMIFLTEICDINYLLSSGLSYSFSTVLNYILSMKYVFMGRDNISKIREFLLFVIMSIIGLGLNQLVMWIATDLFHIYYILSKIGATGIVMVYNFVSRKLVLEKKE